MSFGGIYLYTISQSSGSYGIEKWTSKDSGLAPFEVAL